MKIELIIYAISLLSSTFAVSGLKLDNIIRPNHIWEARFLSILLIFALSYLVSNFFISFINFI